MGNDFIEKALRKSDESRKILKKKEFDQRDLKFILKNSFNVEIGKATLEESMESGLKKAA